MSLPSRRRVETHWEPYVRVLPRAYAGGYTMGFFRNRDLRYRSRLRVSATASDGCASTARTFSGSTAEYRSTSATRGKVCSPPAILNPDGIISPLCTNSYHTKTEIDAVRAQLNFFHQMGFSLCQALKPDNWQGPGIPLDFGDVNSAADPWFDTVSYRWPIPSAELVVGPQGYRKRIAAQIKEAEEKNSRSEDEESALVEAGNKTKPAMISGPARDRSEDGSASNVPTSGNFSPRTNHSACSDDGDEDDNNALGAGISVHAPKVDPSKLNQAWRDYKDAKLQFLSNTATLSSQIPNFRHLECKAPLESPVE